VIFVRDLSMSAEPSLMGVNAAIDAAILEAQGSVASSSLSLPWESGALRQIFQDDLQVLAYPKVQSAPFASVLVQSSASEEQAVSSVMPLSGQSVYKTMISKAPFLKPLLSPAEEFDLLAQRFEVLLSHNFGGSMLGRDIQDLTRVERVSKVGEALGGKALNTLRKRVGQCSHFVDWCLSVGTLAFPVNSQLILEYTDPAGQGTIAKQRVLQIGEVVRFLHFVLGVDLNGQALGSPIFLGRLRKARLERPARKQARPLTVKEVVALETMLRDTGADLLDRYCAGIFLVAVYGRARLGDLKEIEGFFLDLSSEPRASTHGYGEFNSLSHKSRSRGNAVGMRMPIVFPATGLGTGLWLTTLLAVSVEMGHPLDKLEAGSALMRTPNLDGSLSTRPLRHDRFVEWASRILTRCGCEDSSTITGHSAKSTLLSWMSKFGGSYDERTLLGHHALPGRQSLATYSRDLQASPLRSLETMLDAVRSLRFNPDNTRSGMIELRDPEADDEPASAVAFSVARSNPSEVMSAGTEVNWYRAVDELEVEEQADEANAQEHPPTSPVPSNPEDYDGAEQNDSSGSGSGSSSSDDSSSESLDERLQFCSSTYPRTSVESEGCTVFQHPKTKTMHLYPIGSTSDKFVCGRAMTSAHKSMISVVSATSWLCKQCKIGKPLKDLGSLNVAIDRALKKRRVEQS
jgi:hypothetical protein